MTPSLTIYYLCGSLIDYLLSLWLRSSSRYLLSQWLHHTQSTISKELNYRYVTILCVQYSAVLMQSREHCSHEFFIGWHKIQFKCEKYLAGAKNLKGSKNLKKHNFKIKLKFKYAMLVVFWCYVAWCVVLRWGEFW